MWNVECGMWNVIFQSAFPLRRDWCFLISFICPTQKRQKWQKRYDLTRKRYNLTCKWKTLLLHNVNVCIHNLIRW